MLVLTGSLWAASIWWPASFSIVGCPKTTLLFQGAAAGILISAGELCDGLHSGLGETCSFGINSDLMIKWQHDFERRDN